MKLHYYPETGSLYIELQTAVSAAAREIVGGVNIDFDHDGNVEGIDIDQASRTFDLSAVETAALPTGRIA